MASSPARYVAVDAARLLAVFAIIWIHVPRTAWLGPTVDLARFAVPFFTAGAVFFVMTSTKIGGGRAWTDYVWSRFKRIYFPFLVWSAVYLAFKAIKLLVLPDQPNDFPGIRVLWVGGAYHLWFLPFIFLVSVSAFFVSCVSASHPVRQVGLGSAGIIMGAVVGTCPVPGVVAESPDYLLLIWNTLPAAFWAVPVAIMYRAGETGWTHRRSFRWACFVLLCVCAESLLLTGRNSMVENIAGMALLLAALSTLSHPWLQRMAGLGRLAFGIYFAHLLFIKVLESAAGRLQLTSCWQLDLLTFAVAAVGSTLLAWGLSRSHHTRWLVA